MKLITPFGFKFNHDKSFFQVIHRYMQISNFTYFNMLGKFLKRKKIISYSFYISKDVGA